MYSAIFLLLYFWTFIFVASYSKSIKLWTNLQVEIPLQYRVDSSVGLKARQALANAMSDIEKNTCIRYFNKKVKNLNRKSVLEFCKGFISASYVGQQDGVSSLWVTDDITRNQALHELMHSLGFFHEHNRPDRDKYIEIMWDNIFPENLKHFKKINEMLAFPYDYKSITHYPTKAFSKNGNATIIAKNGEKIEANGLSEIDIAKINKLYNCHNKTLNSTNNFLDDADDDHDHDLPEITSTSKMNETKLVSDAPSDQPTIKEHGLIGWPVLVLSCVVLTLIVIVICLTCLRRKLVKFARRLFKIPCKENVTGKTLRILESQLTVVEKIGEGHFGEVLRALYQNKNGPLKMVVAVKCLTSQSQPNHRELLLPEAMILSNIIHDNIIKLLGICMTLNHTLLVFEYINGGNAIGYLSKKDSGVNTDVIPIMLFDILKACCFLETNGYIHRDIAARNCLVVCDDKSMKLVITKLADFGLAVDVGGVGDYESKFRQLPIRYCAPEVFDKRQFSNKSDVWSYGILIWELYTIIENRKEAVPFENITFDKIPDHICKNGNTLCQLCPEDMFNIMQKCTEYNREDRPSFAYLHDLVKREFPIIHDDEAIPQTCFARQLKFRKEKQNCEKQFEESALEMFFPPVINEQLAVNNDGYLHVPQHEYMWS